VFGPGTVTLGDMANRTPGFRGGLSAEERAIAVRFDQACGDRSDAEVAAIICDTEANARAYRRAIRRVPTMAVARLCPVVGIRVSEVIYGPEPDAE
jgi:hypothetical protein